MKNLFLFLISFSMLSPMWLSAEATDEAAEQPLKTAIQPRKAGAAWIYRSWTVNDGVLEPNGATVEQVIDVKVIDGVPCYLVRLAFEWRSLPGFLVGEKLSQEDYDYFWEYFNEDGSYHLDGLTDDGERVEAISLETFDLTLPFPVKKGHAYKIDGDSYRVLKTDSKVVVAAGEFMCTVYEMKNSDEDYLTRERLYMSPGVGLVRYEMDNKLSGQWELETREELEWYNLAESSQ